MEQKENSNQKENIYIVGWPDSTHHDIRIECEMLWKKTGCQLFFSSIQSVAKHIHPSKDVHALIRKYKGETAQELIIFESSIQILYGRPLNFVYMMSGHNHLDGFSFVEEDDWEGIKKVIDAGRVIHTLKKKKRKHKKIQEN